MLILAIFQSSSTLVKVKSSGSSSSFFSLQLHGEDHVALLHARPSGFEIAVAVQFQAGEEADELLPVHVLPVGLGGEQIGGINAPCRHLGEELLDQRIDAPGAQHQAHRRERPVQKQRSTTGQQCLAADFAHQTQFHRLPWKQR